LKKESNQAINDLIVAKSDYTIAPNSKTLDEIAARVGLVIYRPGPDGAPPDPKLR